MKCILFFLALLCALPLHAVEFQSDWQGMRPWVGPEYWAAPLFDWETVDGTVVASAAPDCLLHLLSHRPLEPENRFHAVGTLEISLDSKVANPANVKAAWRWG